jgi:hypothetical protein
LVITGLADTGRPVSGAGPATRAHRVVFVDLGRFLALAFMLYGHTVDALLDPAYREGAWFDAWQFQRGLTSSLFLLLSGFAFSVATARRWGEYLRASPALLRRVRRFGLFVLLGYALHMPVSRFAHLPGASGEQWRALLAVDVLQLIGVTYLIVQGLVLLTRTPRRFLVVTLVLGLGAVGATPLVRGLDWAWLPAPLAAYLTPATGSLFPLFPYAAYILLGAALGQVYAGWGASRLLVFAGRALVAPGAVLAGAGVAALALLGASLSSSLVQFALRLGTCLLILAAVAYASRRIDRVPRAVSAMAQETLLVYFVHLCLVYGSIWNSGLQQWAGAALGPGGTARAFVVLLAALAVPGWRWHWVMHARPRAGPWARAAAAAVLVVPLL